MFKKIAAFFVGVAVALGLGMSSAMAQVTAPTDATAQIQALVTGQAEYLTVMFALAFAAVGIMIGVKWIKRARGAA